MGQNNDGTYTKRIQLLARDVDLNNKLKMSAVFSLAQDVANDQCVEFGCARQDLMEKYNVCYILSRIRFEMSAHPSAGDEVIIRTWPSKNVKAILSRYFTVESIDGSLLGCAVSQWALFNLEKRAVVRPSEYRIIFPEVVSREEPFTLSKGNLYPPEIFESGKVQSSSRIPSYNDFDYNRHVNNAKYVEWAEDALTEVFFAKGKQISSIDIKYKHEIALDEFVKMPAEERIVKIECAQDEQEAFCIRSVFADGKEGIQCIIK